MIIALALSLVGLLLAAVWYAAENVRLQGCVLEHR